VNVLARLASLRRLTGAAIVVAVAMLLAACASAPSRPAEGHLDEAGVRDFAFTRDTFAFPNAVRAFAPEREDLYANYCFVLARGMRQFFRFARFDPEAPRLDRAGYVDRVRRVAARVPWEPPVAADDRVVIPGYASLREFSLGEESAVKEGLGGRFWTFVHWTNWRVVFPRGRDHQEGVLDEIRGELEAGRLAQLLITNWPILELNHTVVAFASRVTEAGVELAIWDPNEPERPGVITFDSARGQFWATRVFATRPGAIRVFRMYYSPLL
jgi:hypothetical protein